MATKYYAVLTNVGAAKLANATALGVQVEITQMAVGDGNGALPTPNPAQTALVHELRRAPLNSLSIDPNNANQIIAEQVIPEDVGGWWIREIGLFDKDGDMIAVANCAETYKPQLQEGSGRVQTVRMILIVSSTAAVTLKIDPSVVLATRQYVDSQLSAHEQSRNHPDASTTDKGFVQLTSSVISDSESQAATPKAVKIAMDNANARLEKDRNLSDLSDLTLARQNLELGDSSTRNVGTTAGTVAEGDDDRITGAMQKSQNGADIPDVEKFLQNLGLGALQSSFTDKSGKIALNGGWGLGIKADQVSGTMAALDVSRFDYFAPADNIGPYPGQWAGGISFANSGSTGWQICGASLSSVPDFSVRIKTSQTTFSDWYKLYHTGFKPTPADINAIQRDACDVAGFIYNNQQDPYIRHSASQNLIQLATRQFVSQSISSLSLGTAATKNVGTGAGQIPDMSSFTSGTGWASLPGGTIIQWGIAASGQIGDPQTINFPVPFTNYSTVQLVASYDNAGASAAPYSFAAQPISNTQFKLLNSTSTSAVIYARWIAIGR
ncbi:phage tail protein [Enterobacter hormaechei subsp. hoffmannii]|uniref:phage tail protein n=1 Tax=Enterobacter hormaechei TaxID=158836 RepID=UPI0028768C46|nr:phage tail protein [Enterobacter hormaechei]MDS0076483.1 phage tail protein [Enterobacter hormaechei subsp. hoffmannii]